MVGVLPAKIGLQEMETRRIINTNCSLLTVPVLLVSTIDQIVRSICFGRLECFKKVATSIPPMHPGVLLLS